MRRILLAALAAGALALTGCAAAPGRTAAQTSAASIVSAYVLSANAAVAFEAAHPADARAVRACDDVAWAAVKPISDSLVAGADPTAAELAGANAALSILTPCLTAAGVKS